MCHFRMILELDASEQLLISNHLKLLGPWKIYCSLWKTDAEAITAMLSKGYLKALLVFSLKHFLYPGFNFIN